MLFCLGIMACGGKGTQGGDAGVLPDGGGGGDAVVVPADGTVTPPDAGPCIDMDGDGHCRGLDCDDENPDVHPEAAEICGNGLDDNCDSRVDEGRPA